MSSKRLNHLRISYVFQGAAFQSRVPFDKMTQVEAACFPDLVSLDLASQKLFLHLRNRILQMWLEDPKVQLTLEDVQKKLRPPWDSDEALTIRYPIHLPIMTELWFRLESPWCLIFSLPNESNYQRYF